MESHYTQIQRIKVAQFYQAAHIQPVLGRNKIMPLRWYERPVNFLQVQS